MIPLWETEIIKMVAEKARNNTMDQEDTKIRQVASSMASEAWERAKMSKDYNALEAEKEVSRLINGGQDEQCV